MGNLTEGLQKPIQKGFGDHQGIATRDDHFPQGGRPGNEIHHPLQFSPSRPGFFSEPQPFAVAVSTIEGTGPRNHRQTAVGIAADQARQRHEPILVQRIRDPPQREGDFPGIGKTLSTQGIIFIRGVKKGEIIGRDRNRVGPEDGLTGSQMRNRTSLKLGQLLQRTDAVPELPFPVIPFFITF